METSVRGYLLKEIVQKNRLFTVYNAEHAVLTGQKLRITIINELFANDPDIKSAFEQSIFKLAFAEHDNIVENIDMLEENHKLAILSKTDDFSKLDVLLENLSIAGKFNLCKSIIDAIEYLNSRNIYVTNLCSENMLIDSSQQVKISNPGLVNVFLQSKNEDNLNILRDELVFAAPEIFSCPACITQKSDVYTCTAMIKYIFGDNNITNAQNSLDLSGVPDFLHDIVRKGMHQKADNRFKSSLELLNILSDSIYKNENYSEQSATKNSNQLHHQGLSYVLPEVDSIIDEQKNVDTVISDDRVEENVKSTSASQIQIPKKDDKDVAQSQSARTMNYHDLLAEIKAEKLKKEKDQTEAAANVQQVRSSSYIPQKDSINKNNDILNKKEAQRVQDSQQTQKQSCNYPQQSYTNSNQSQNKTQYFNQTNKQDNPSVKINTNSIVIIGFISFVFAIVLPFVGFVLAIVGLSQIPKNKRKLTLLKRKLTTSEKTNQSIGVGFCIIALIISVVRLIMWFVSVVVI
ncbi:MAG: protein kinase [Bacteroidales bacterium]|nr:protein kinase [Bacteroidales bacterium]